MGDIILLKTLTRKSIIQGGKNKGLAVADLLRKKKTDLIYSYFNYDGITFTDDILDELNIYLEDRIKKPGKDPDKYSKYAERNIYAAAKFTIINKTGVKEGLETIIPAVLKNKAKSKYRAKYKALIEREKKTFSKGSMMRKNHGHK